MSFGWRREGATRSGEWKMNPTPFFLRPDPARVPEPYRIQEDRLWPVYGHRRAA